MTRPPEPVRSGYWLVAVGLAVAVAFHLLGIT